MKFVLALALLVLVVQMASTASTQYGTFEEEWSKFQTDFNKTYNDVAEEAKRKAIFEAKLMQVKEHNKKYDAGEESYSLGINQYSDLDPKEVPTGLIIPDEFKDKN